MAHTLWVFFEIVPNKSQEIYINTVLLVFVFKLVSHIVICNSYTTSNTSDRSNTKTSNTSTVS